VIESRHFVVAILNGNGDLFEIQNEYIQISRFDHGERCQLSG
jgi:hypothetical protein